MNATYLLAPVLALFLFAGIYQHNSRAYEARRDEEIRSAAVAKAEAQRRRDEAQARAVASATAAMEQRKRDADEKSREEDARRKAKLDTEARRQLAIEQEGILRLWHARRREEHEHAVAEVTSLEKSLRALRQQQEREAEQTGLALRNLSALNRLTDALETEVRQRPTTLASAQPARR